MATNQTLAEALELLKEIKNMQISQGRDIESLKRWKIAEDAYKAALMQVRKDEREEKSRTLQDKEAKAWLDILKQVGPIITVLGAVIYAWAATRGIH